MVVVYGFKLEGWWVVCSHSECPNPHLSWWEQNGRKSILWQRGHRGPAKSHLSFRLRERKDIMWGPRAVKFLGTDSRMLVARGWGGIRKELEGEHRIWVHQFGTMAQSSGDGYWWLLSNSVKVLNVTQEKWQFLLMYVVQTKGNWGWHLAQEFLESSPHCVSHPAFC